MTEQERAAAIADEIAKEYAVGWSGPMPGSFVAMIREIAEKTALRAYARPAPADLREAIISLIVSEGWYAEDSREPERLADAILSLLPQTQGASDAVRDVIAERRRQVEAEGWTPEHDDEHKNGELLRAAKSYLSHATNRAVSRTSGDLAGVPLDWPWDGQWWKPKAPRQDLIRAGALALAEIERIKRLYITGAEYRCLDAEAYYKIILIEIERLDRAVGKED